MLQTWPQRLRMASLDSLSSIYFFFTPEIKIKSTDEEKFNVVKKVQEYAEKKGYHINTIDGVRVDFEYGWALVRASNTGPNVTARFEGITEKRMNELKEEFMAII